MGWKDKRVSAKTSEQAMSLIQETVALTGEAVKVRAGGWIQDAPEGGDGGGTQDSRALACGLGSQLQHYYLVFSRLWDRYPEA